MKSCEINYEKAPENQVDADRFKIKTISLPDWQWRELIDVWEQHVDKGTQRGESWQSHGWKVMIARMWVALEDQRATKEEEAHS